MNTTETTGTGTPEHSLTLSTPTGTVADGHAHTVLTQPGSAGSSSHFGEWPPATNFGVSIDTLKGETGR